MRLTEWTAEAIAALRKQLGLTQRLFGEEAGVTDVYVAYLEAGTKHPSKTLQIVFDCLKKKADRKGKGGRHGKEKG